MRGGVGRWWVWGGRVVSEGWEDGRKKSPLSYLEPDLLMAALVRGRMCVRNTLNRWYCLS